VIPRHLDSSQQRCIQVLELIWKRGYNLVKLFELGPFGSRIEKVL
jgi:hypothetical protein